MKKIEQSWIKTITTKKYPIEKKSFSAFYLAENGPEKEIQSW